MKAGRVGLLVAVLMIIGASPSWAQSAPPSAGAKPVVADSTSSAVSKKASDQGQLPPWLVKSETDNSDTTKSEDLFKSLDYPELEVTPLASQRLAYESKVEHTHPLHVFVPIGVSALTTLSVGLYGLNRFNHHDRFGEVPKGDVANNHYAAYTAIGVGAGWLITGYLMSALYHPYQWGAYQTQRLPTKTKRQKLVKERLAEEWLKRPADLGRKLTDLSVFTNLAASLYLASQTDDNGSIAAAVSAIVALNPWVFTNYWQQIYQQHEDYKKRIYGPISTFLVVPKRGQGLHLAPGLAWVMSF